MTTDPNAWEVITVVLGIVGTLVGILGGAVGAIAYRARKRADAKLERVKQDTLDTQRELEETRNQGAQMKAVLDLFRDQMKGMTRLVTAIEQGNEIQKTDSAQHAKVVDGVMKSNERIADLITNFQSSSATQHNQTRDTVNAVGGKVDTVIENLQQASVDAKEFRKGMNGRFNDLGTELRDRFESLQHNLNEGLKKSRDTDKLNPAALVNAPDAGDGSAAA